MIEYLLFNALFEELDENLFYKNMLEIQRAWLRHVNP